MMMMMMMLLLIMISRAMSYRQEDERGKHIDSQSSWFQCLEVVADVNDEGE